MRALIADAVSLAVAGAAAADPVAYQPGALPHDEASLRALDNAHLRIVRRARARSAGTRASRSEFSGRGAAARACIIGETESAVRNSDDPALQAYHQALPFNAKYNEYRPAFYWQRLVAG